MANVPVLSGRGGIAEFAQESWNELRKVTWPDRQTIVRLTVVVILISVLIAAYIFLFDNIFTITVTQTIVGAPTASPSATP
ncbi:MAG TPA: preprotein translocase subunit SecE [Candidatus Limnocylindria bacterium]